MTPAQRVAAALLDGDVPALRALLAEPSVTDVARAGLARLDPQADDDLPAEALDLLRAVSGHPGLSGADLRALAGEAAWGTADLLLARGLVTSRRFERADCWSRTAAGAAVLRAL